MPQGNPPRDSDWLDAWPVLLLFFLPWALMALDFLFLVSTGSTRVFDSYSTERLLVMTFWPALVVIAGMLFIFWPKSTFILGMLLIVTTLATS